MKRRLLLVSAVAIVLTASGSIANAASGMNHVGVRTIAADRERAAFRHAERLMREFVPPPEARATRKPPGYGTVGVLRQSGSQMAAEVASVHRFWTVRKSLKAVAAFVRAHRLPGFGHFGGLWYTRKPHYLEMGSSWPAAPDNVPSGYFDVTVVELPHATVLRADARVIWTYPRSPSEKVPSAVRMIDIHVPQPNRVRIVRVLHGAKLARIIRSFDALPISPPGVHVGCLLTLHQDITLDFRNSRGDLLAQAGVPRAPAGVCQSIGFKIGSHIQRPLIDSFTRGSFIGRLAQLTGLELVANHR